MTHLGYLIAGWSISFVAIVSYIFYVLKQGRPLSLKVPEARRRWMSSPPQNPDNPNN